MRTIFAKHRGFTLIELLIVVAIIAILAAIAVPNFLEAQTRAKVSRVRNDFRALSIGLEAYCMDTQHYPPAIAIGEATGSQMMEQVLFRLSTPIAYMSSVSFRDPFGQSVQKQSNQFIRPGYLFVNYEPLVKAGTPGWPSGDWATICVTAWELLVPHRAWCLNSPGPDRTESYAYFLDCNVPETYTPRTDFGLLVYDATNGTVSNGDIIRLGGEVMFAKGAVGR